MTTKAGKTRSGAASAMPHRRKPTHEATAIVPRSRDRRLAGVRTRGHGRRVRRPPTGCRFPDAARPLRMTAVAPTHRCGAVPDSHQVPSCLNDHTKLPDGRRTSRDIDISDPAFKGHGGADRSGPNGQPPTTGWALARGRRGCGGGLAGEEGTEFCDGGHDWRGEYHDGVLVHADLYQALQVP